MKTILFDPGKFPYAPLADAISEYTKKKNKLVLVTKNKPGGQWDQSNTGLETLYYSQLQKAKALDELTEDQKEQYVEILERVINDYRTFLLYERVYPVREDNSLPDSIQHIDILVFNSIGLLNKYKPDILFFPTTPHHIRQWALGRVAEYLGIEVLMLQLTALPWKYRLAKGIDDQKIYPVTDLDSQPDAGKVDAFIDTTSKDFATALPTYEKKRIEARKGKFWSWRKELKDGTKNVNVLKTLMYKHRLYKTYHSLCINEVSPNDKFIAYFMHVQPERTSLPEGRLFSQQWLIIRTLSLMLPKGWKLLVKEHPSTFMATFDPRYRSVKFYQDIAGLSNVDLLPISFNTFDIIDRSQGIATITGSVGIQALVRGKSVLTFGVAPFRDAFGAFEIYNTRDIKNAIEKIIETPSETIRKKTAEYLHTLDQSSVSGFDGNSGDVKDIYAREHKIKAHIKLLSHFFRSFA
ncbi:MAG: hypothetical protein EOP56_11490 [Sphingobacteriales bacterium]|nr:MAG: hypothetical protein EOP56_11490 [Sphingobacteriales bacterium]